MVATLDKLKRYRIILASASPRRKELLSKLDIGFTVKTLYDVDESFPASLPVVQVPQYISRKKADAYRQEMQENDMVITADTVVAVGRRILGKPKSAEEARVMLKLLSDRYHRVVTGVTIMTTKRTETFATVSRVRFTRLNDEEIDYYISKYKPFDKAGAYGIQEWIGMVGITELNGSYFNVMGLPVQRLYAKLKEF
jgi:septum formation protein